MLCYSYLTYLTQVALSTKTLKSAALILLRFDHASLKIAGLSVRVYGPSATYLTKFVRGAPLLRTYLGKQQCHHKRLRVGPDPSWRSLRL